MRPGFFSYSPIEPWHADSVVSTRAAALSDMVDLSWTKGWANVPQERLIRQQLPF